MKENNLNCNQEENHLKKKKKNEAGECHDSKCYIEKKKDTQPTWKK